MTFVIVNMRFSNTGNSIFTRDPIGIHLENIVVDHSRVYVFLESMGTNCNYPEAFTTNTIYINNITQETSTGVFGYGRTLSITLPGNHTISNVDCSHYSVDPLNELTCLVSVMFATCAPQDDLAEIATYHSLIFDGKIASSRGDPTVWFSYLSDAVHYRQTYINFSNFTCRNYQQVGDYSFQYIYGSGSEIVTLSNFELRNISHSLAIYNMLFSKQITMRNFTFTGNQNLYTEALVIITFGSVEMDDFKFINHDNQGGPQKPVIDIICSPMSDLIFNNFNLQNVKLDNAPLIKLQTIPKMITLHNSSFADVQFETAGSLFEFQLVSPFSIANHTFSNVRPIDASDTESKIFNTASIYIDLMTTGEIIDIQAANSSFNLFGVTTILNPTQEERTFKISNIKFYDCIIPSRRVLISTKQIIGNTNLKIFLDQIRFNNINFRNGGTLLGLYHQLSNEVVISNSSVTNIIDGSVIIQGSSSQGSFSTKAAFKECEFSHISLSSNSLIVTQNSVTTIESTSLTNATSISAISGILSITTKSTLSFTSCRFQNNSAIVSALGQINQQAVLTCSSCVMTNNFGLQNGLFQIESFGVLKLLDSQVYRNFGVQNLVANIFLGVDPCEVKNTTIYGNLAILKAEIPTEITSNCTNLCFLSTAIKTHLSTYDLTTVTESSYLFEVVQASLEILSSSSISDQSLIINSFISTITIDSSILSDLSFSASPFKILSSSLNLINVTSTNIIDTLSGQDFVTINSGTIVIKEFSYVNANSKLLNSYNCEISIEGLSLTNTTTANELIYASSSNMILIKNLQIQNASYDEECTGVQAGSTCGYGVIRVQKSANVSIQDTTLTSLSKKFIYFKDTQIESIKSTQISAGLTVFTLVSSNITELSNSEFVNNTGDGAAGVLAITDSRATIKNCTFSNNTGSSGGVISFECNSDDNCELDVSESKFQNNSANIQGGAIYYSTQGKRPTLIDTNFTSNSAPYGPDYASYPARIGKVGSKITDQITLDDIGPGITIETSLELALLDMDDQVMNLDNTSTIIILPKNSSIASIQGTNVVLLKNGIATFDSISMEVDKKYKTANYSMTSKSIDIAKISSLLSNGFSQANIVTNFRDCQPGEQISGNKCSECPAGTYSLNWNSTQCSSCDLNADCLGGNQVSLKSGYWRRFQNSTKIVECINKDACAGGYSNDTDIPTNCATGYSGNLCSQCLVTDDVKYERVNDFECRKCPNPVINALQVIGVMFLVLGFFIFMVVINVRKTSESQVSVLLRILTNYLQLITVSTSMSNDYPSAIISAMIPMKTFGGSTDAFMSFDCFLSNSDVTGPFGSNAIFKLFLLAFLPLILFGVISLMWAILYWTKPTLVKDMKRNLIISLITVVFILHPKIAERSISMFRCVDIDEGVQVARVDTTISCYSYTHIKWCLLVSVPIIVIWVTACPLVALFFIYKYKNYPENNKVRRYFLTIYQGLRPNAIYWEFVNTLRKILILLSLLMNKTASIFASSFVLIITARLQIYLKPYKNREHYKVEFLAMMAGVCTIIAALLYSQEDQIGSINVFVLLAVLLVNFKFLSDWFYLVLELYQEKNKFLHKITKLVAKALCKRSNRFSKVLLTKPNLQNQVKMKKKKLKKKRTRRKLRKLRQRQREAVEQVNIQVPQEICDDPPETPQGPNTGKRLILITPPSPRSPKHPDSATPS